MQDKSFYTPSIKCPQFPAMSIKLTDLSGVELINVLI
jgi:hypothetical protein